MKNGHCRDTRHIRHTRHRTNTKNKKHNTTQKTKNMSNKDPDKKPRRSRMISYFSICQLHDNVQCNYVVRDNIVKHFLVSKYERYSTKSSSNIENVNFYFIDL